MGSRWLSGALCAFLVTFAAPVRGQEEQWLSNQEERLTFLDRQVLEVQQQRATAVFLGEREKAQRLAKQVDEMQKERRALLQAMGQLGE